MTQGQGPGLFNDFERAPVPEQRRSNWLTISMVYTGLAISLSAFILGGALAAGLTLGQAVLATFLGTLVSSIVTLLCSKVALETHFSTAMISRITFGHIGAIVVMACYSFAKWGWFGVQTGLFGDTISVLYGMVFDAEVSPRLTQVFVLTGGLLMMTTAIIGYRAIEKLSVVSVPLLVILMLASLFKILQEQSLGDILALPAPVETLSLGAGISIIAGSTMAGAIGAPDIMRYSRSLRDSAIAIFLGFMIGYGVTLLIATLASKVTGEANIVYVMISLGWGVLAMLVLVLAQWTSNDNNLYSAALGMSMILYKVPKWKITAVSGIAGTLLALMGIYDALLPFLLILSALLPPIGAIYILDFFLNRQLYHSHGESDTPLLRKAPTSAWIMASLVGLAASFEIIQITTVSAIDSFLAGLIIYGILVGVLRSK